MAGINNFIAFVIAHEAGGTKAANETNAQFFERTRAKGWSDKASDRGGKTQTGVTLTTYKSYCKTKGLREPTADDLRGITYDTWKDLLKTLFWDKWQADKILNDSIAVLLVDWVWASGPSTIAKVQKLIGTTPDGIVGPKTLTAINTAPQISLFGKIKERRVRFIESIIKNDPSQKVNYRGWMNRLNHIKYEE